MNNKEYLLFIGLNIKRTRKAKGVSQEKLAELCKMDWSGLIRVEKGRVSCRILTLKTIADVLGVDVKDLL